MIQPGDALEVRNAYDTWLPAVAVSGVEGTHKDGRKIHDFPVVWVELPFSGPIPWPVEDVREAA